MSGHRSPPWQTSSPAGSPSLRWAAPRVVLRPEWLDEHRERRDWCDDRLAAVLSGPPGHGDLESELTVFDHYWDSFCADIAAAEWARAPEDPGARWFVAQMATSFRYET